MTDSSPSRLVEIALDAASAAARFLLDERPDDLAVAATKSSPTDVVTEMDTAAEKLIAERIRAARPDDAFLGEEGGEHRGGSGVRWIIDPIDGTVNYLYDIPAWAVSIAAEHDGDIVAGVVAVPPLDEVYHAVRGGGAFRRRGTDDPKRLSCRPGVAMAEALVATGFGYQVVRRTRQGQIVASLLPRVRDIRRAGAAALDLCGVACGRTDAYYERGTHLWDVAAGSLVATEAGARVGSLTGDQPAEEMIIAAPEPLFSELRTTLLSLDAGHD